MSLALLIALFISQNITSFNGGLVKANKLSNGCTIDVYNGSGSADDFVYDADVSCDGQAVRRYMITHKHEPVVGTTPTPVDTLIIREIPFNSPHAH